MCFRSTTSFVGKTYSLFPPFVLFPKVLAESDHKRRNRVPSTPEFSSSWEESDPSSFRRHKHRRPPPNRFLLRCSPSDVINPDIRWQQGCAIARILKVIFFDLQKIFPTRKKVGLRNFSSAANYFDIANLPHLLCRPASSTYTRN